MSVIASMHNVCGDDKNKPSIFFIITTLLIFPLPQIAIDLYLPSLPSMAVDFHSADLFLQLTLTVYVLTLGLAQLIYGPFSDKFGRKKVLLTGMTIFFIGSLACTMATSVMQLLIFRIIQGLGMGCGFSVGSAILGDSFSGKKLAIMTAFSSMVYSLSPLFAPVLGGYIHHYVGWQGNFIFMALFCFVLLLAVVFVVHETNRHIDNRATDLKRIFSNYFTMITHRKFLGYIFGTVFCFGIMITFNVVGPFLLQNILKVSVVNFGALLFLLGLAYMLGTFINSQILHVMSINYATMMGLALMLLFSGALLIFGYVGWFSPMSVTLFTCLVLFATGFVFPNCFAKALEIFPEKLGTAGAFMGSSGLISVSIISAIVAHVHIYSEQALGWAFLIQAVFCVGSYLFALMDRDKK